MINFVNQREYFLPKAIACWLRPTTNTSLNPSSGHLEIAETQDLVVKKLAKQTGFLADFKINVHAFDRTFNYK